MTDFVKFTHTAGDVVYVNPAMVWRVRSASANQTLLVFSKDDSITVKEKLEDVMRMLEGEHPVNQASEQQPQQPVSISLPPPRLLTA